MLRTLEAQLGRIDDERHAVDLDFEVAVEVSRRLTQDAFSRSSRRPSCASVLV